MPAYSLLRTKFLIARVKGLSLNYIRNISKHVKVEGATATMSFNDIPGPKSWPLVGTLYQYLPFIGEYSAESLDRNGSLNWRKYGWLAREELLQGTGLLHVFHPDDMETVFRMDDRFPARRSHLAMLHYREGKPEEFSTGGLLATNGSEWWRIRSKFQKNFTHPQSVKEHVKSTDTVVKEFIDWLKSENVTSTEDLLPYLNRLNLEIIGRVAFNEEFNSFSPSELEKRSRSSRIIQAAFDSNSGVMKLDKGFLWRIFNTPLYKRLVKSQDYLTKVASEILLQNVSYYKELDAHQKQTNVSLLTSFLGQPNLSLKDIRGMMVDILMAGIDTTSYSVAFALYHLAKNSDCQEKIYEEAVELLPNGESEVTAETLSKAAYTRCCVKESLRLNPVSIGVGRILQKDIVLREYLIPKGTVIVTQNMVASRLPQLVRLPMKFKPDRWMRGSEDYETIHPFLSLPFGFGPRSCIARRLAEQNITVTLLKIIRNYRFSWHGEDLGIKTLLINKPDCPLFFCLKAR